MLQQRRNLPYAAYQHRSLSTYHTQPINNFSVNRTLEYEKKKIVSHHNKKLQTLVAIKCSVEGLEENPNDTIINLTEQSLSPEQMDVLKLGV